ncbi:hypothetical protein QYM36_018448 [Artemia franciscana]|uniref:Uncharacterized protein n=1 Tax=Artemia franciscana TaxID=6661 RepID=A0AA88H8Y9_ARTSF|nr:hypothetical protein QYM36_018448 [Artemia franciscana]
MVIEMKSGSIIEDVEILTAPLEKYLFPVPLVYYYALVTLYRKIGHRNEEKNGHRKEEWKFQQEEVEISSARFESLEGWVAYPLHVPISNLGQRP